MMEKSFFTSDQQDFLLAWVKDRERWWCENKMRSLSHKFSRKFGIRFIKFKAEARKFFHSVVQQKKELEFIAEHKKWQNSLARL